MWSSWSSFPRCHSAAVSMMSWQPRRRKLDGEREIDVDVAGWDGYARGCDADGVDGYVLMQQQWQRQRRPMGEFPWARGCAYSIRSSEREKERYTREQANKQQSIRVGILSEITSYSVLFLQ